MLLFGIVLVGGVGFDGGECGGEGWTIEDAWCVH